MITKFKIFEELNEDEPAEEGDYVICSTNPAWVEINDYLKSSIGRIESIGSDKYYPGKSLGNDHLVYFTDVPVDFKPFDFFDFKRRDKNDYSSTKTSPVSGEFKLYYKSFNKYEIKYWSKDKDDVEAYIAAQKYNIA